MTTRTNQALTMSALGLLLLVLPGCQTHTGTAADRRATQGAVAGVLAGAAAGAAIDDDERGRGALIGAALGGVTGGLIGHYLDRQSEALAAIPDATVDREGDLIVVGFPADLLFEIDSAALAPGAYARLDPLADTLLRHPRTEVSIRGHTDATGAERHNLRLSEDRAASVRSYLLMRDIDPARITAMGFGEAMPVATNATPEGRQQNRRVELEIRSRDGGAAGWASREYDVAPDERD